MIFEIYDIWNICHINIHNLYNQSKNTHSAFVHLVTTIGMGRVRMKMPHRAQAPQTACPAKVWNSHFFVPLICLVFLAKQRSKFQFLLVVCTFKLCLRSQMEAIFLELFYVFMFLLFFLSFTWGCRWKPTVVSVIRLHQMQSRNPQTLQNIFHYLIRPCKIYFII